MGRGAELGIGVSRHPELTWLSCPHNLYALRPLYRYFADCRVDCAVLETGLGGTTDATNVLPPANLLTAVITGLGGGPQWGGWTGDYRSRACGQRCQWRPANNADYGHWWKRGRQGITVYGQALTARAPGV